MYDCDSGVVIKRKILFVLNVFRNWNNVGKLEILKWFLWVIDMCYYYKVIWCN